MPVLLTWWMTGPVAGVLCSPAGVPLVAAGSVAVLAVVPVLVEDGDQLSARVRTAARHVATVAGHAVVTAALVVAVHAPAGPGVAR